jgi:hypothetical protein
VSKSVHKNARRAGVVMAGVTAAADAAGTGAVFGAPSSPIELICAAATVSTSIIEADMTAVRVNSVNGAAVTAKPAHPRIMNHFVLPRPSRSQAHR